MSDRTSWQMRIVACPDKTELARLRDILDEYVYGLSDPLTVPAELSEDEVVCGTVGELTQPIVEAAPGATWIMWEDPKYEWLGDVAVYTPELGLYTQACDSDGNPVFTDLEIESVLNSVPVEKASFAAMQDAFHKATGKAWFAAIEAIEQAPFDPAAS